MPAHTEQVDDESACNVPRLDVSDNIIYMSDDALEVTMAAGSVSKKSSADEPADGRSSAVQKAIAGSVIGQRVAATLSTAAANGLTRGKKLKRLSGRAHEELVAAAAARSGLEGSDLLEYALAKVALEDDFAERLLAREGTIGRDVDLGL